MADSNVCELRALQRRFWRLIVAPEGVEAGLRDVVKDDPGAQPLSRWIRAKNEATATQRLDVYANMYFYRLHDALADDFKILREIVGVATFNNIVTTYLLELPSENPSLRYLGERFPAYVGRQTIAEVPGYAAELARFEWERQSIFDCEDVASLSIEALGALPADAWPSLRLTPIPAFRLVTLSCGVHQLWAAHTEMQRVEAAADASAADKLQAGEAFAAAQHNVVAGPFRLIVWRPQYVVKHRLAKSAREFRLLQLCAAGHSFAEICEVCAQLREEEGAVDTEAENDRAVAHDGAAIGAAANEVTAFLASWVRAELLTRFSSAAQQQDS